MVWLKGSLEESILCPLGHRAKPGLCLRDAIANSFVPRDSQMHLQITPGDSYPQSQRAIEPETAPEEDGLHAGVLPSICGKEMVKIIGFPPLSLSLG